MINKLYQLSILLNLKMFFINNNILKKSRTRQDSNQ